MCRNIKVLRRTGASPSEEEVHLAALQYVRKVSGFHKPSRANQMSFDAAVQEVAAATGRLLATLRVASRGIEPPIDREKAALHDSLARPRVRKAPSS